MFADFLYAFSAVMPIFIVAFVGYALKNKNFLTDEFVKVADKLVFNVMLPCLLFTNVAFIDLSTITKNDLLVALFCIAVAPVLTGILCLTVPVFVKDKAKTGAFIQGVFRSNVAFLGIPFAQQLFGDAGAQLLAIVLAGMVPIYNVLAVMVLCIFDPEKDSDGQKLSERIKNVLVGVYKNPLIRAIVIALPFGIFGVGDKIPDFIIGGVEYFAKASTTLALITIGASFRISELKGRINLALYATILKTVVVPSVFMVFTYFVLGFKGVQLGTIMIVFGTPTAISSYIMAKNMHSDASLANQIVLLSTLVSMFTIFLFSFLLRSVGLI